MGRADTLPEIIQGGMGVAVSHWRLARTVARAGGLGVISGVGPDLMEGARSAVSQMIDLLCGRYDMQPVEAYMLCSVCADLRVSEIVDMPNWVVSFYFPRLVLD